MQNPLHEVSQNTNRWLSDSETIGFQTPHANSLWGPRTPRLACRDSENDWFSNTSMQTLSGVLVPHAGCRIPKRLVFKHLMQTLSGVPEHHAGCRIPKRLVFKHLMQTLSGIHRTPRWLSDSETIGFQTPHANSLWGPRTPRWLSDSGEDRFSTTSCKPKTPCGVM